MDKSTKTKTTRKKAQNPSFEVKILKTNKIRGPVPRAHTPPNKLKTPETKPRPRTTEARSCAPLRDLTASLTHRSMEHANETATLHLLSHLGRGQLQEDLCFAKPNPNPRIAYAERRVKPLARLLRCATALRVTAPLGYGSRRLV